MRSAGGQRFMTLGFALMLLAGAALKVYSSQLMTWEVDYVPLIARGQAWLHGGDFPVVGTLSSVAAFNMPFLVWMQIPALLITNNVKLALLGTQLSVNLLTTCVIFRLGGELFDRRAGLLAAALFTFSEVGIASAYTAWAQMQLPGFFALIAYLLYRWKRDNRSWAAALTLILATAAFMTHFSAVLLYAVIVLMIIALRFPVNWRAVLVGLLVSGIMLAPYLAYEARVDFVDLKAFFTRRNTISAEVLAEYDHLKPAPRIQKNTTPASDDEDSAEPTETRLERGLAWLLEIPLQVIAGLRLAFNTDLGNLRGHQPLLHALFSLLRFLLEACFWLGIVHALYRFLQAPQSQRAAPAGHQRPLFTALRLRQNLLLASPAGRNLFLLLFTLLFIVGLVLARADPGGQQSYYYALIGLQFLSCAYGIYTLAVRRKLQALAAALVLVYAALGACDTVIRVANHDRARHSGQNLSLYSNMNDAAGWVASDWAGGKAITVSYDLLPEMSQHWWVLPWSTVDESYRLGMAFDFLLASYYDLENSNRSPLGLAEEPDYVFTSPRGLRRYDLEHFQVRRFGAIHLLKPG
ncbi:MAG: glycosyltransferase family 39 protein [Chloroflexota bacterium]|nr:glycosyltransferase family 39 protein [Chloroflexota bacterium]